MFLSFPCKVTLCPFLSFRDALLCSILDGVRASGNKDICVKMAQTRRGHRLGPLNLPVGEEVESQYLKYIVNLPQGVKYSEAVERFNSNVSYSGLNHAVSQGVLCVCVCVCVCVSHTLWCGQ